MRSTSTRARRRRVPPASSGSPTVVGRRLRARLWWLLRCDMNPTLGHPKRPRQQFHVNPCKKSDLDVQMSICQVCMSHAGRGARADARVWKGVCANHPERDEQGANGCGWRFAATGSAFSSRACTGQLRLVAMRPGAPETAPVGQKEGAGVCRPRWVFATASRLRPGDGATQQGYSSARNSMPITRGSLTKPVRLLKSIAPISARLLVMLRPYRAISRRP